MIRIKKAIRKPRRALKRNLLRPLKPTGLKKKYPAKKVTVPKKAIRRRIKKAKKFIAQ